MYDVPFEFDESVVLCPVQIVLFPLITRVGVGLTVKVNIAEAVQLLAFVTVTE